MAEQRSDAVHADYRKSSEQFDYFALGLISAIVAYLAQNVTVSLFSSFCYDIYLLSLAMLLASMCYGFWRLEQSIVCTLINHTVLYCAESKGELVSAVSKGIPSTGVLNTATGQLYGPQDISKRIAHYGNEMVVKEKELEEAQAKAFWYYKVRNRLFIGGFVGVLVAKILTPYLH